MAPVLSPGLLSTNGFAKYVRGLGVLITSSKEQGRFNIAILLRIVINQ